MSGTGLPPGVHRLDDVAPGTVADLRRAGWRLVLLPPVASTAGFYAALAVALPLPAWFGGNLDALADSLADLAEPTALVLQGWQGYAGTEPAAAGRVLSVLAERAAVAPPFAVLLA